jgi:hypothetical protein
MSVTAQWWGFSKEHGWVIMDRDIPCNLPGLRGELMFYRCRDSSIFFVKRELWMLPAYQYAPNYVRAQTGEAATEAAADLDALMARWPEFQLDIQRQHRAIVEREEAERREVEKRQKKESAELKKQRLALEKLNAAAAASAE